MKKHGPLIASVLLVLYLSAWGFVVSAFLAKVSRSFDNDSSACDLYVGQSYQEFLNSTLDGSVLNFPSASCFLQCVENARVADEDASESASAHKSLSLLFEPFGLLALIVSFVAAGAWAHLAFVRKRSCVATLFASIIMCIFVVANFVLAAVALGYGPFVYESSDWDLIEPFGSIGHVRRTDPVSVPSTLLGPMLRLSLAETSVPGYFFLVSLIMSLGIMFAGVLLATFVGVSTSSICCEKETPTQQKPIEIGEAELLTSAPDADDESVSG